jgi:protein TonB
MSVLPPILPSRTSPAVAAVLAVAASAGPRPRQHRLSLSGATAVAISVLLHGMAWTLYRNLERPPEAPPPLIIEATMVTLPAPARPQPPEPPKPAPAPPEKPAVKPPEKPKPVAKPKPHPRPAPEPAPQAAAAPAAPADPAPPATVAAPVQPVRPAPIPGTDAKLSTACTGSIQSHYPTVARQRGWQGTVVLHLRILPSGKAEEVRVERGSGHEMLDEAAIEQVRACVLVPATQNGVPVESVRSLPISFTIAN